MNELINEPPNSQDFKRWVMLYLSKSYCKPDKDSLLKYFGTSEFDIKKTGNWGKLWGYAEAILYMKINPDFFEQINKELKLKIIEISNTVIKGTQYGIEICEVEVLPRFSDLQPSLEQNIEEILVSLPNKSKEFDLPADILIKAREMSEAYLYIYFIENALRVFIANVSKTESISYPKKVRETIDKNKNSEKENKFLPLRGDSDLFYCDFVHLGAIISSNWVVFKDFFPNNDEHWLRVKIEDLYRIRCLIAHCGYIGIEEKDLVRSYFNVILKQLK